jgi:UDP-2-acetamido-3-amino-2,3-dideoxy-glucuronate N-acetyltransferase
MARDASVFVHERALCETDDVGPGTRIWAFAHVMKNAKVGAGCNVCDHAFIESGAVVGDRVTIKNCVLVWDKVTIEDEVFLGPNMVFTNDMNPRVAFKKSPDAFLPTVVKKNASIGANATIVCGVTIGENAFVGAGSVVIRDVPPYAMVVGNPARRIGWMCACGAKLPRPASGGTTCTACGRGYLHPSDAAGLVPTAP